MFITTKEFTKQEVLSIMFQHHKKICYDTKLQHILMSVSIYFNNTTFFISINIDLHIQRQQRYQNRKLMLKVESLSYVWTLKMLFIQNIQQFNLLFLSIKNYLFCWF